MKFLLTLAVLCVILVAVVRTRISFGRYRAALNALLAKDVYQSLDSATRDAIRVRVEGILANGGVHGAAATIERMREREWYGFVALALREMGVSPAAPRDGWNPVRNPFVALARADRQILLARRHLQETYGIQVDLE